MSWSETGRVGSRKSVWSEVLESLALMTKNNLAMSICEAGGYVGGLIGDEEQLREQVSGSG